MTLEKFLELVRQMRTAQCDHLAHGGAGRLIEAKRLEKLVDQALQGNFTLTIPVVDMDEEQA